jgi:hypothetical protein
MLKKILKTATLYRKGTDPNDPSAEWRQLFVRSDRFPPTNNSYAVQEFSGLEKATSKTSLEPATLLAGTNYDDALAEFDKALNRLENEGFEIYCPQILRTS